MRIQLISALIATVIPDFASADGASSTRFDINASFVETKVLGDHWIGFISNDSELFIGECSPLEMSTRTMDPECRWPKDLRWSIGAAGRDLLLLTTLTPDAKARSFVVEASTGKTLASKRGISFSPPAVLHPDAAIWATTRLFGEYYGESVELFDLKLRVVRRAKRAEMSQKIHELDFTHDGSKLVVWPWRGMYTYDTTTWTSEDFNVPPEKYTLVRESSRDGTLTLIRKRTSAEIVCRHSRHVIERVPVDTTRELYPVAYSTDMKTIAVRGKSVGANNNAYGVYLLKSTGAPFNLACNEVETAPR